MTAYGRFTQVNLSELGFLSEQDLSNPQFNRDAARFALELAAVAYDFDVDRWLDAGWTDISIQADEKLLTGVATPEYADRPLYQRMLNEWRPIQARRLIASQRVIKQARGVIWRPTPNQTGKAITMIRAMADGRFAVIIGFMGTGKRRIDWESNFRLAHPEGYHEGFMALTQQFEENSQRIQFEQTAQLLGLASLSLQDVLEACTRPDSRFVLLAAGHSQGAAVLQLWMLRQLAAGLRPEYIMGYGFASPSVAARPGQGQELPLYHLINSDDIVPRVGLLYHLGRSYVYQADAAFRAFCYQGRDSDPLFMQMLHMVADYQGTRDMLALLIAYIGVLGQMEQDAVRDAVALIAGGGFAERIILRRDEPLTGMLRLMGRMLRRQYELAGGGSVDEEAMAALAGSLLPQVQQAGAERYTRMMLQVLSIPHALVFREVSMPGLAPYAYMVLRGFAELKEVTP